MRVARVRKCRDVLKTRDVAREGKCSFQPDVHSNAHAYVTLHAKQTAARNI